MTPAQTADLASFLRGLAAGRGGDLYNAARATCERWANELATDDDGIVYGTPSLQDCAATGVTP